MSKFLKCDTHGCDHIEDVAAITEDMIGRPCPRCGANLLTREDFDFYASVLKPSMELMQALGLSRPAAAGDPKDTVMRVGAHGGELRIKLPSKTA